MVIERRRRLSIVMLIVALLASACTSDASTAGESASEPEPTAVAAPTPTHPVDTCAIGETIELLQSGLLALDYQAAGSYESLDESAQVVVIGHLTSVERTGEDVSTFTELSVEAVTDLEGTERPDVEVIAWQSRWDDASVRDPIGEPHSFDDVRFLAFLTPWSGRRSGWNAGAEGLYVSCGGPSPLRAVFADGRSPDDPENPSIDELAALLLAQRRQRQAEATQQPGSEYSDDELRQLREDAIRANPTRVEAIRDALVAFAAGGVLEPDEIPLSAQVALGLGADTELFATRSELQERSAWMIERPQGYAGFDGPYSALDVLTNGDTQIVVGEHDHCAGGPLARPEGFEHHAQVSIQPAEDEIDSCIAWFAVDLFLDPRTLTISAITLALFGP